MKKILLGSTALLGFGLMSSSALAQVELSISGNMRFEAGYVNEDDDSTAERDYAFRQDGVLQFNAAGTADNGLEFGGEVELDDLRSDGQNTSGDGDVGVDELYVYVGGGFGQVRLGDKEGAAANFGVTAPTTGSGGFDGNFGQYMIGDEGSYLLLLNDNDFTRISYFTPEIGGFQGGISFTPSENDGKEGGRDKRTDVGAENILEAGANYSLNVSGFDLLVGATAVYGQGTSGFDDPWGFHVGGNVGFGGLTVGAAYLQVDYADGSEEDTIQLGATYEIGPWTVGASAALDTVEALGVEVDTDIYAVGGTYAVAPGLSLYTDLMYVDVEDINDATVFVVGTTVSF